MAKGKGFQAAAKSISSKEGMPMKNAMAVLASGTRKAGKAARKANPNLAKVR